MSWPVEASGPPSSRAPRAALRSERMRTGHTGRGWRLGRWKAPLVVFAVAVVAAAIVLVGLVVVRGNILGAGGAALTPQQSVIDIGVVGGRIKDPAQLAAAFTSAKADPAAVNAALGQAAAHPNEFVKVLTVPDDTNYAQNVRPAL